MENVRVYTYGDILCLSNFNEFKWDAAILYVSTLRNTGASSIHDITLNIWDTLEKRRDTLEKLER
jgi:hypothetical protein